MPSRPMPQSDEITSRSAGMYLSALADVLGDLLRPLDLQRMVVDDADADFLVGDDLAEGFQVHAVRRSPIRR